MKAYPLNRDHLAMQLSPVKVADALSGLLCGGHGDKAVAASPGALGVGHYLCPNNLWETHKETSKVSKDTQRM